MNRKMRRRNKSEGRSAAAPSRGDTRAARASAARLRQAGRIDEAERLYRTILKAEPDQPTALNWLGALRHLRGDDARALELLTRAARIRPQEPLCLFHLAEVCRASGRFEEAADTYRRALQVQPVPADLHFGLGTALLNLGRAREAADALSVAVAHAPDDPEARNNLGNALSELGETGKAEAHYRAALACEPRYAEAQLNLGLLLAQSEREEAAEACLRKALALDPALSGARRQLSCLLVRTGRAAEALDLLHRAVEADASSAGLAQELGDVYRAADRYAEAADWYARALDLDPDDVTLHVTLGQCLFESGRLDEALRRFHFALERDPDLADAHFNTGLCLQSLGRFEDAIVAHERALALRPDLAQAHINLATIQPADARQDEIARLEALLSDASLAPEARINLNFALAKRYEARADTDAAFGCYQSGNALKAQAVQFDATRHADFVDRCIAIFDQAFFAARQGFGAGSDRPVFILGMPRSGTTLVEQILAAHPDVHAAGELDDFRRLIRELPDELGRTEPFPECARALDRSTSAALADKYLDSLERRFPHGARITDKMTGNYLRLGLIALLVPQATVIHCRRDPIDTCLSCYFQNFANGLSFTYDLEHLGVVYRHYTRLMAHWRRVLPMRILDVQYEDLVARPEMVSRDIVAFCNLQWDARCLAFHAHERPVKTASLWQVRQPIYASSIGRWRRYEHHLRPLLEALGDVTKGVA